MARIVRPRGNKGEVLAELFTDHSSRLSAFQNLFVRKGQEEPRSMGLQNFWMDRNHPEHGIFHFAGCSSIDAAEKLRGLDVLIPVADRVELPAGNYFVSDLIGCTVFEIPSEETKLSSPACPWRGDRCFLSGRRDSGHAAFASGNIRRRVTCSAGRGHLPQH